LETIFVVQVNRSCLLILRGKLFVSVYVTLLVELFAVLRVFVGTFSFSLDSKVLVIPMLSLLFLKGELMAGFKGFILIVISLYLFSDGTRISLPWVRYV
jgi:hypothetical protein